MFEECDAKVNRRASAGEQTTRVAFVEDISEAGEVVSFSSSMDE
jgi:hypothetical protein